MTLHAPGSRRFSLWGVAAVAGTAREPGILVPLREERWLLRPDVDGPLPPWQEKQPPEQEGEEPKQSLHWC
jgi:hypothetical protein